MSQAQSKAARAAHVISTLAELEARYTAKPMETSLLKEVARITPEYARLIAAAPFFALASAGPDGLDCSPRGDAPGFVRVLDETTIAFPDRNGNNRIDTLRNLLAEPRVALLFLIPGVGETLRINGRASISIDPELIDGFAVAGKPPRSVILVDVDSIYYQCARAIMRSGLWDAARQVERASLPSSGDILAGIRSGFDKAGYDARMPQLLRDGLY
jgi:PPOX class probable FMN-dependent enzyme